VASGAGDAAWALANQLHGAEIVDSAVAAAGFQVRRRDGLSVGQSLVVAAIARLVRPSSKRAIGEWAAQTSLPDRFRLQADSLTSQHFWDQMHSVPLAAILPIEQRIVA